MAFEYFIVVIEFQEIGDLQQDFEEKKCKLKEDFVELSENLQELDKEYTDKLKTIQNKKDKAREKQQKVLQGGHIYPKLFFFHFYFHCLFHLFFIYFFFQYNVQCLSGAKLYYHMYQCRHTLYVYLLGNDGMLY